MTLHQTRRHETTAGIGTLSVAGEAGPDRRDAPVRDGDVDCRTRRTAIREPRISQYEIKGQRGVPLRCSDQTGKFTGGYWFASSSSAVVSTRAPAARSAGFAFSASLWETPFSHGTKIIAVGQTRAMYMAS